MRHGVQNIKHFAWRAVLLVTVVCLTSCEGFDATGNPSYDYYGGGVWYYPPPNYAYIDGEWVALPPPSHRPGNKPGNRPGDGLGDNSDRLRPSHPIAGDDVARPRPSTRPSSSHRTPSIPSRHRSYYGGGRSYGGGRRGGGGRR